MVDPVTDRLQRLRAEIVATGKRLYGRGLVGGSEGNISVRVDTARILATPSGLCKGFLTPEDLVVTDATGKLLSGNSRPSSELKMHLKIYALREDVQAVVHAHPPVATGFSIAGQPLNECVVPEVVATLGWVPIVPYGTPSTDELAERLTPYARAHDALLLANHGAVTYGASLERAINIMESLEQATRSLLVARLLGKVHRLSREDVDAIVALDAYGTGGHGPACSVTDPVPLGERTYPNTDPGSMRDDVAAIVREALRNERRADEAG